MLILFDQSVPVPLRRHLQPHLVLTAAQRGWDRLENGRLIAAAEAGGFDLFITTDKNMRYQQSIASRRIAVLVLGTQQWPQLKPHVQLVATAVARVTPGCFVELDLPPG